ncbi:20S proteasome subunit beta 6 [Sphaeroforma arctica JP610]|uniref:Proteasome subunit beta n=1 Tax=Sphaeroforma arctica JP610 TaxID=667725 RepID=A0A0L0FZQ4_9EUKA|nr:20S proteasome subunit beta 6 [Sphaeroforma arctica JP610]KNC82305.1 20S proteasome subunit beta 6 [Sphaeroforma arctica JP610]|eukprot:XP_014156207.1 20S proteasome subunit beta 6 [Sphaeroforma arctica JP610]
MDAASYLSSKNYTHNIGVRSGLPESKQAGAPKQHHGFSPYVFNGGTTMAIAGDGYVVVAGDTRLSAGYEIMTRDHSKLCKLNDRVVLASIGFQGDSTTLHKHLKMKLAMYKHNHDKDMGVEACAQMLMTTLYYKRFFPYYTINILVGLDKDDQGAVYHYDPIGSFERETYRAAGTGSQLLQPLLDSEVGFKNKSDVVEKKTPTLEEAINLCKDAFAGVAERDIYTGDRVQILIITKDGVKEETFTLRRD